MAARITMAGLSMPLRWSVLAVLITLAVAIDVDA
jgi:hypothetical protein